MAGVESSLDLLRCCGAGHCFDCGCLDLLAEDRLGKVAEVSFGRGYHIGRTRESWLDKSEQCLREGLSLHRSHAAIHIRGLCLEANSLHLRLDSSFMFYMSSQTDLGSSIEITSPLPH